MKLTQDDWNSQVFLAPRSPPMLQNISRVQSEYWPTWFIELCVIPWRECWANHMIAIRTAYAASFLHLLPTCSLNFVCCIREARTPNGRSTHHPVLYCSIDVFVVICIKQINYHAHMQISIYALLLFLLLVLVFVFHLPATHFAATKAL